MSALDITKELIVNSDDKYKEFQAGLIPGIDNILGVRAPIVKAIAKRYAKNYNGSEFLSILPHTYYDENTLHGYMLGFLKTDTDTLKEYIRDFLPYVDNWAVCDSMVSKWQSL
jgi:3-methyladenine DNA glycosylase AlkD